MPLYEGASHCTDANVSFRGTETGYFRAVYSLDRSSAMTDTDARTTPTEPDRHHGFRSARIPLSVESNPLLWWLLITGNRWTVSVIALLSVGFGLVGIGVIWMDEVVTLFTETRAVQTILNTLLSGIILLVSIVVSVNSIVLSQEITALGDQEEAVEETFSFRNSVQEHTEAEVSPARPARFLKSILEAICINVQELRDSVPDDTAALYDHVNTLRDDIVSQAKSAQNQLETGELGLSEVLFVGIEYDYSQQVYAVRRLRIEYRDVLTDTQRETIDELLTLLRYFTIGREYFKTLYYKRELANLSRNLIANSFLAIVFLSYALLAISAGVIPEFDILGIPSIIIIFSFTYILGLSPYTLFSAYVLRSATISIKTLAAGPFILEAEEYS